MRICIAGAKSCPPEIGGIEVFAFEVGRRLVSQGTDVTVIVPRRGNKMRKEEIEGMTVRRVLAVNTRHALKVSMMPAELMVASGTRPDVFHANDPPSGVIARLSSRWKASVLTVHGLGVIPSEWSTPFRQAGLLLQRLAVRGATSVVTTDNKTALALGHYRPDIDVIPSGVDAKLFRRHGYTRPNRLEPDRINVLYVGRLTKGKGYDLLIDSLNHMRPDVLARIRLTVIGNGPLPAESMTTNTHPDVLNWIGEIPHKDIPPYFANADMLVVPSRSEGLPISILEAMSAELPVVSSTVGGIGTYFDERYLTKINSITPEGVAKAIENAVDNRAKIQMKAGAARELVESQFTWDRVTDLYLRLYEKSLEKKASAREHGP